jgi:hypothetical protein
MAPSKTRAELEAELHRLQIESNREATFGGWTREAEEAHQMRSDRIADLYRQLDTLRKTCQP